ncbi:RNA-binding protein 4B-like isoform X1 [Spea bombifrons]|uniref:RNA-binding protein 4B-like isoform X1 n=1 Tax=Spea bombifrons TaxID=233779 RepID=UPI00234A54BA|nr:RNA-binding protein 4B-like isoform X1 [Spea bombifrons]
MVKLFVGNLPPEATQAELKALFEQFGRVTECDIIKNYGFVHMEDKKSADDAVLNLNHYKLHDVAINVENSRGRPKASTKLHVSNLGGNCTSEELRAKFEAFGSVLECDIVKDYAFVHMERADEALEAIRNLDNTEFKGKRMHVQLSTSRLRVTPGMGDRSRCYRCGKEGHWSKECPLDQMSQELEQQPAYPQNPYPDPYALRNVAAPAYNTAYAERVFYDERERCGVVDYYQHYRVRPSSFDPYVDRRLPPVPPPSVSNMYRERIEGFPYERHLLPPPPPIPNPYFARERSPLRRSNSTSSSVDGFRTERRLSPGLRNTVFETPRTDRARF